MTTRPCALVSKSFSTASRLEPCQVLKLFSRRLLQGVRVISTPVNHYRTDGPVALRLEWNGLSVTYSGAARVDMTPSGAFP